MLSQGSTNGSDDVRNTSAQNFGTERFHLQLLHLLVLKLNYSNLGNHLSANVSFSLRFGFQM